MNLTDIAVKQLKAPATGFKIYADDALPGFGVRVTHNGIASFVLTYGRARKRVTIGRVGVISLKDARAKAKTLLAERTLGKKDVNPISFEAGLELFLKTRKAKDSTRKEDERLLRKHFLPKWRHEKVHTIQTGDVTTIVDGLEDTPSEQGHAFAAARLFFNWAEKRRHVETSPLRGLDAPALGEKRARVLGDDELTKVARTAFKGTTPFHKLVGLLLLSAQRRKQIQFLDRKWIGHNSQAFIFPAQIMKGNREHVVPYGDLTGTVLSTLPNEGLLFPAGPKNKPFSAFSKCKKAFDKECGVNKWTLHDLRRTARTGFAKLKVAPHIGERILDHRSATESEVSQIYDRFLYLDEMREAVVAWENYLLALLAKEKDAGDSMGNVTVLSPGQQVA